MTANRRAFNCWAPSDSPWSDWAKPALFATAPPVGRDVPATVANDAGFAHLPEPTERLAVIVDLAGPDTVSAGLALARRGYRPVPLYNTTYGPMAAVDVIPIAQLLIACSEDLQQLRIGPDAPPVFLLDSNRLPAGLPPGEGIFDNRWMVFPQDFPSAIFLKTHGIERTLLVQNGSTVREDLAHVLLRCRLISIMSLRRNNVGGFGAVVPIAAAG